MKDFKDLTPNQKWNEAETLTNVDWCCADCGEIVDDGEMPEHQFMGSQHCGNCDTMLTKRTSGGQSDPFNFIPKKKMVICSCGHKMELHSRADGMCTACGCTRFERKRDE